MQKTQSASSAEDDFLNLQESRALFDDIVDILRYFERFWMVGKFSLVGIAIFGRLKIVFFWCEGSESDKVPLASIRDAGRGDLLVETLRKTEPHWRGPTVSKTLPRSGSNNHSRPKI